MELKEAVEKRKSIRRFRQGKVEKRVLKRIFSLASKAPSAGNLQAFKIIAVESEELKKKVAGACRSPERLAGASAYLVFVALPAESSVRYGERGEFYSLNDAVITAAYTQLIAVDEGLATLWIGAFDEEIVARELELSENERPVVVMPIGFAGENPERPERKPLNDLVEFR